MAPETRLDIALAVESPTVPAAHGTATITGQVLDGESGQPLSGVRISIPGSNAATVSTASDGRFQFAAFPESKAEVQAELSGYQRTATSWVAGAGPLTVRLSGGASLKGNVVAEAYDRPTPIFGAAVRLVGSDSTTATDRDGRFCLASLVGGRDDVQVEISAEGYATRTITTALPNDGAAVANVALTGVAAVNGSVTDQFTGKPIAEVAVSPAGNASQDADGTGREVRTCCGSPRQPYPSRFPRRLSRRREIDDRHGQRQPADRSGAYRFEVFARRRRLGSPGRRRDAYATGRPRPPSASATVAVKGAGLLAKADAKGHFSLDEFPPEPVTLVVKAPGFLPKEVQCDPAHRCGEDDPLARRFTVSGRVIDTTYDPPRPIPAATIRLDDSPIATRSNDQGQFVVDGVPSGAARIIVSAPGYIPCELSQRLRRDAPNQIGDIALAGNSEVEGTVVTEGSGRPVAQRRRANPRHRGRRQDRRCGALLPQRAAARPIRPGDRGRGLRTACNITRSSSRARTP